MLHVGCIQFETASHIVEAMLDRVRLLAKRRVWKQIGIHNNWGGGGPIMQLRQVGTLILNTFAWVE